LVSLSFDPAFDDARALAATSSDIASTLRCGKCSRRSAIATIRRVAHLLRQTGVVVIDDGLGGLSHNAAIHVVDADRRLRRIYDLRRLRAGARVCPNVGRRTMNARIPWLAIAAALIGRAHCSSADSPLARGRHGAPHADRVSAARRGRLWIVTVFPAFSATAVARLDRLGLVSLRSRRSRSRSG
jgi:hypothetical protein